MKKTISRTAWRRITQILACIVAIVGFALPATSTNADEKASPSANEQARGESLFRDHVLPVLKEHCYRCHSHDGKRIRGGLVVDSRNGMLKGGDTGPAIVPGDLEKSLLMKAVSYSDLELRMPPNAKLPESDIKHIREWIELGAPDSRKPAVITPRKQFAITEKDRRHWAYQPVANLKPPAVENLGWLRSDIDHFVLAKLEERGLQPSERANRYQLIRRVTFDLIGLPPTPNEIKAFVNDESPNAYEKVVDRLLASKEFGVHWAQHWLDGVRYATDIDKSGLYRDWVVRSFNNDLPYDEFVRLQIAGDLIPAREKDPTKIHESGASLDGITATGMLALAVWERVARDLAVAEIVDSQVDLVGRQILGMTVACARCHDHKYDPIANADYYAMAGIFFSSHITPGKLIADGRLSSDVIRVELLNKVDAEYNRRLDEQIKKLETQLASLEKEAGPAAKLHKLRDQIRGLTSKINKAKGNAKEKLENEMKKLRSNEKKLFADQKKNNWPLSPPQLADIDKLNAKIATLKKAEISRTTTICAQEGGVPGSNRSKIADVPIYIRGDHRKEGPVVPRRFPVVLSGEDQVPIGERTKGSGRLELANWIASPENPLTARVMVNRVWMHLLGNGLVRSPDNFGMLGDRPSHPELLDYLTQSFIDSGWSVKSLIKRITLSSTYQQSSFADAKLRKDDPENRLLARANRTRLTYEQFRDSLLSVSGELRRTGGKAKRTLYEPVLRGRVNQTRAMFDGPDPNTMVAERPTSTTTTQALYLMNNPFVVQAAKHLAENLQNDATLKNDTERIRSAYLRMLGRLPTTQEIRIGQAYLERGSWTNYMQILFCTNEFVYVD